MSRREAETVKFERTENALRSVTIGDILDREIELTKKEVLDEAINKVSSYGSVWMEFNDGMSKEEVAREALKSTKEAVLGILKDMREGV